jgi:hypothetical protein
MLKSFIVFGRACKGSQSRFSCPAEWRSDAEGEVEDGEEWLGLI